MSKTGNFFLLLVLTTFLAAYAGASEAKQPALPPSVGGNSYVQAGAYAVPSNARNMQNKLRGLGYSANIVPGRIGSNKVGLVRIHNLSAADAYSVCSNLTANGISCFTGAGSSGFASSPYVSAPGKTRGIVWNKNPVGINGRSIPQAAVPGAFSPAPVFPGAFPPAPVVPGAFSPAPVFPGAFPPAPVVPGAMPPPAVIEVL